MKKSFARTLSTVLAASAVMTASAAFGSAGASDLPLKAGTVAEYDASSGYLTVTEGETVGNFAQYFTDSVTFTTFDGKTIDSAKLASDMTVTCGSFSAKLLVYGDVNRDGGINAKDVSAMMKKLAGNSVDICEAAFDANCDGSTNAKDVALLLKSAAGWSVTVGRTLTPYQPGEEPPVSGIDPEDPVDPDDLTSWIYTDERITAPGEDGTLEVFFTGSTERDSYDCGRFDETYSYNLRLAKNEYEGCHADLYSFTGHTGLNATLSDFTDKKGNVLESELRFERYINVKNYDMIVPDMLAPMEKDFSIEMCNIQGLFISVHATKDTPAGIYRAILDVTDADGNVIRRSNVFATVWDFTLPEESHVKTAMGMGYSSVVGEHGWDKEYMYDVYYEFFLEHRLNPWCMPYDILDERADAYMNDPRVNTFLVAGGYGGDAHTPGKSLEAIAQDYEKLSKNENWLRKAMFYLDDEPMREDQFESIFQHEKQINSVFPNARVIVPQHINWQFYGEDVLQLLAEHTTVLCTGERIFPTPDTDIEGVENWYEQWSLDKYGPLTDRLAKFREEGKELWWYTANTPMPPMCNISVKNSGMECRMIWWLQYNYDIEGFLYWATTEWDRRTLDPGVGCLVYPGTYFKIDEPIPSQRIEIVRDGIEDVEYLTIAQELWGREKANEYLRQLVTDVNHFCRDEAELNRVRTELGNAIEEALSK